jgi:site-specific DNA recombinase
VTTAIYARISDDRRDGVGVDNQVRTCREWCATEGWAPATEYIDNDVSASVYAKKPRKAFQALLRAVEAGEVERIVCFATDRLYRQPRELEVLIPLAERVEVRSKVGGLIDLSTAGGRLSARIQGALAANESDLRSERIRLAQTRARSNGDPHGGARPFGWLALDGSTGRSWDTRRHDPKEAAVIRQAAVDVLSGARIGDVARHWNAAGVPQASGIVGRWHPSTVRGVLTNPRSAGLVSYRGDVLGPGDWPPILDRQTWERTCAELTLRRARFAVVRRQQYLLSGVLVCGICGATLSHGVTRRSIIYRCYKGPGIPGCGRIQIAAEPLERDVTEALFEYVDGVRLAELAAASTDDPAHAASLELAQLEREAAETADLAAAGSIRPADFARYSAGIEERRRRLRGQIARLSGDRALEPYAGRPGVLRAAWPDVTTSQRRGLILSGLGRLVVDSGRGRGYDFGRVRRAS